MPGTSLAGTNEKEKPANSIPMMKSMMLSWMYPPKSGSNKYIWNWFIMLKNPVDDEAPDIRVGALEAIAIPIVTLLAVDDTAAIYVG